MPLRSEARVVTHAGRVTGLDAMRMLLALGFRIGHSNGSIVALEGNGNLVFVPRDEELSQGKLDAILGAAGIAPAIAYRLLARLKCRDTLPDTEGTSP